MQLFQGEMGSKITRSVSKVMAGGVLALALSATSAFAVPFVDYTFSQYTGNTNTVMAHVEETSSTVLTFTLTQVDPNPNTLSTTVGEFRAFYFSVANDSLLSGAVIAGTKVTSSVISAGAVSQIVGDNDTKMVGGTCGSGCLFDVGVGFGTAGLDNPAITSTTFTFTQAAGGLSLASFFPTTGNIMGARLKNFTDGGSSKDTCISCVPSSGSSSGPGPHDVPEPATLGLFGAALIGLGLMRRRKVN